MATDTRQPAVPGPVPGPYQSRSWTRHVSGVQHSTGFFISRSRTLHLSEPKSIWDVASSRSQAQAMTASVDVSAARSSERGYYSQRPREVGTAAPLVLPLQVTLHVLQCRHHRPIMLF